MFVTEGQAGKGAWGLGPSSLPYQLPKFPSLWRNNYLFAPQLPSQTVEALLLVFTGLSDCPAGSLVEWGGPMVS